MGAAGRDGGDVWAYWSVDINRVHRACGTPASIATEGVRLDPVAASERVLREQTLAGAHGPAVTHDEVDLDISNAAGPEALDVRVEHPVDFEAPGSYP